MPNGSSGKGKWAIAGCVVLTALALWRLALGDFRTPAWQACVPVLDSFSEPAVCLARLRQEGESLMLVYTENRDWQEAQRTAGPVGSRSLKRLETPAIVELHAGVQALHADLDRKLLAVYYESASWSEFVDCYLRLVQQTPERTVGEAVSYSALDCARKCGRTNEVMDALRHIILYRPYSPCIQSLKRVLDCWEAEHGDTATSE